MSRTGEIATRDEIWEVIRKELHLPDDYKVYVADLCLDIDNQLKSRLFMEYTDEMSELLNKEEPEELDMNLSVTMTNRLVEEFKEIMYLPNFIKTLRVSLDEEHEFTALDVSFLPTMK